MNQILVIGSTGKVGQTLVKELVRAGEQVRAATRDPSKLPPSKGIEPVSFDYADRATFAHALAGSNRVFFLEPQVPSEKSPAEIISPFLEAATRNGRKLVFMSTASAEFGESEPLLEVERAVERSGAPFVILRPNWFMDNFHTLWLPPIKEAGLIPVPAAESRSSFIDSRDIARSAAAALRTDRFNGRAIKLTGPESLTYGEAAAILSTAAGREIQYVPVDDAAFIQSLIAAGLPPDYAEYIAWLFRNTCDGSAAEVTNGVEELTGQVARTLAQYARDHAAAWK
jgi:uncharacterized protein YbjT (DUF2867 family)